MPKVSDSRVIRMPRKDIYRLLMNIEAYPDFIPFIRAARIVERRGHESIAEISIGLGNIGFTYKCRVTETPYDEINIVDIAGPFRFLRARLTFEDEGSGSTRVGYHFESQFRSRAMNLIADPVFNVKLKGTLAGVEKFILKKKNPRKPR